jgi:hypothetical protein
VAGVYGTNYILSIFIPRGYLDGHYYLMDNMAISIIMRGRYEFGKIKRNG